MADDENIFNQIFGNPDSDAEFEGFELEDINDDFQMPTYEAPEIENDVDLAGDVGLGWKRDIEPPLVTPFIGNPGLRANIENDARPIDYFNLFVTENDFESIAFETNRYFNQVRVTKQPSRYARMNLWFDTSADEMMKFIGLTFLMGLVKKSKIRNYWSTDPLINTPSFPEAMPRDRFLNLLTFLHIADNDRAVPRGQDGFDPLYKIRPIYDVLSSRFRGLYRPTQHICIDEAIVPWKGRLRFKQYIPSKPDRFGVKWYALCESDSKYMVDFDIYTAGDYDPNPDGDQFEINQGHSFQVVIGLLRRTDLLNQGYLLYLDNFYSSPYLFDHLAAEDTMCVGTVRLNRKEMPQDLKMKLKGDAIFRQRNNLLAMKWNDKRDVAMLSTVHTNTMTVTEKRDQNGNLIVKPTCIVQYNSYMGGVDGHDQLSKYYSFTRKTLKWWVKLFFHVINLAATNAFLLYVKNNAGRPTMCQEDFRLQLSRDLIMCHAYQKPARGRRPQIDLPSRLTERHFPSHIPAKEGAKCTRPRRKCVVCNVNQGKRRQPGERHIRTETSYWCRSCEKPLCVVDCFERYHTLLHYKQNRDTASSDSSDSE